jgi:hypothetical protein
MWAVARAKLLELPRGHWNAMDPETIHCDATDRWRWQITCDGAAAWPADSRPDDIDTLGALPPNAIAECDAAIAEWKEAKIVGLVARHPRAMVEHQQRLDLPVSPDENRPFTIFASRSNRSATALSIG